MRFDGTQWMVLNFVTILFINKLNLSRLKIDSLSGPYLVYFYCWVVCCGFLHLKLSQLAQADPELPMWSRLALNF